MSDDKINTNLTVTEEDNNEIAFLANNFHHIDAEGLEKIGVAAMRKILQHDSLFQCNEETIARQVRLWALFENQRHDRIVHLIRWNCIPPTARQIIQSRLPAPWRRQLTEVENPQRMKQRRASEKYFFVCSGFKDPFFRTKNRHIFRLSSDLEIRTICQFPDLVPDFSSPSSLLILDGFIYITYKASMEYNSRSYIIRYETSSNTWTLIGEMPNIFGSYSAHVWNNGIVIVGGRKIIGEDGGVIESNVSELIWFFKPGEDEWKILAPMRTPRAEPCLVEIGEKLYVACGFCPAEDGSGVTLSDTGCEYIENVEAKSWTPSEINFKPDTRHIFMDNNTGNIFTIHQETHIEKLTIGRFDEEQKIIWKYQVTVPIGCCPYFLESKVFIFGGVLAESTEHELIALESLKMNKNLYSIDINNIDDENYELKEQQLESEKMCLFCCVSQFGNIY